MKKIFCDCCGKEFVYGRETNVVNNEEQQISFRCVTVKVRIYIQPVVRNGHDGHMDICANCRWDIVKRLENRQKVTNGIPET